MQQSQHRSVQTTVELHPDTVPNTKLQPQGQGGSEYSVHTFIKAPRIGFGGKAYTLLPEQGMSNVSDRGSRI